MMFGGHNRVADQAFVIAQYRKGVPLKVIAHKTGISPQRAGRIALNAGIPSRRLAAIMRASKKGARR